MARKKFRTYAFLTTDSWRIEVKARNAQEGYRRAKGKAKRFKKTITQTYTTYGRNDMSTGWRSL